MNLRTQMILAGALTLAVPVIGWQSVKQLDASLRQTRVDAQSLKVANARIALAESDMLREVMVASRSLSSPFDLYAEQTRFPMFVDGYSDEWRNLNARARRFSASDSSDALSVRLAKRDGRLFLFLDIKDDKVVYHKPPALLIDPAEGESIDPNELLVNGDAIHLLYVDDSDESRHVLFRSEAPGPVQGLQATAEAYVTGFPATKVLYDAFWAATSDGFHLEISMPLPVASTHFGVAFVDRDNRNKQGEQWLGNLNPAVMREIAQGQNVKAADTGNLFYASEVARDRLKPWVTQGTRARLFDRQGRLLADVNALYEKTQEEFEYDPAERGLFNAVLFRIFAYFVADTETTGQPFTIIENLHLPPSSVNSLARQAAETKHYVTTERDTVLGTLVAVGGDEPSGFLLFESNENIASAYASSRVARLFSLLTLVSLVAGLVLLVYASMLSIRIRNLSREATRAVAEDGRVTGLPQSDARDEIGDLSRNLSALLDRSANYTKYLEALSSRLSHELRTPLSVVKTSIENMNRDNLDEETRSLMDRASGGADQLNAIIKALVESTRLEQTVQHAQMDTIDVLAWYNGLLQRYEMVYPHSEFSVQIETRGTGVNTKPLLVVGSVDLLQQAFDKLVDNAVSFSTDGKVLLQLHGRVEKGQQVLVMSVLNQGSPVPEDRHAQWFDPMFSDRRKEDGELHLGLGLYVVRMIAEAHNGRPFAVNTANGVQVGMIIPSRHRV